MIKLEQPDVQLNRDTARPLRPRNLVHRGSINAAGILFSLDLLPRAEARRRILALWTPGITVYSVSVGLLAVFPISRMLDCSRAVGTPAARQGDVLIASPLTAKEIDALAPPAGSLIIARHGTAIALPLCEAEIEDPATWIDLGEWKSVTVSSLGRIPESPRLVAEIGSFDARQRLAGIPPAAPQRSEAIEALRRALSGVGANKGNQGGVRAAAARGLQQLAGLLKQRGDGSGGQGRDGGAPRAGLVVLPAAHAPAGAPLLDRLADRLNALAARILLVSGMAGMIGRKQSEYVEKMMRMFEQGVLDEALRHAIGLSDLSDGASRPPSLRAPTPRQDLTISAGTLPSRSSLHTDHELFAQLRAMYRQAFEKLQTEGRIAEAAFVLAELLSAHEEAVAFLEKHRRIQLAAEMAEARSLSPGLIVRLWFLAGDSERAARLGWKTGAFGDAILRMERLDPQRARDMRLFWAAELVRTGAYAAAVDVLWPEIELRSQTMQWIDLAIAVGGPIGGRMLARKAAIVGEDQEQARQTAIALLSDEAAETASARQEFISELANVPATSLTRLLARPAARAALRDIGSSHYVIDKTDFDRIVALADDGALRTDLPQLPKVNRIELQHLSQAIVLPVSGADRGALAVHDAALLPSGQTLIALGEAGVRLVTRDGRTIVHWDHPAERLAVSDQGDRAIGLVRRGDLWRLTRFNLISRRAQPWHDAALRSFTPDYDGALWFVVVENALMAIDAAAENFEALWHEPKLEGRVTSLARSPGQLSLLLHQTTDRDVWGRPTPPQSQMERRTYALPEIVLRDRTEVALPGQFLTAPTTVSMGIAASGQTIYIAAAHVGDGRPGPGSLGQPIERPVTDDSLQGTLFPWRLIAADPAQGVLFEEECLEQCWPLSSVTTPAWAVVSSRSNSGVCCRIIDRVEWRVRARFTLDQASRVTARVHGLRLTVGDDLGRLIALDLDTGEVVRNLRTR